MNIQSEQSIVTGYYVVVEVNGHKLYCTPTRFDRRSMAEFWRDRWQRKLPAHTVTVEEEVCDNEVKR